MELIHQHTGTIEPGAPYRKLLTLVSVASIVAVTAVLVFVTSGPFNPTPAPAPALSAQQVVIRGEVADRVTAAAAASRLSPQQIVVRGEVADRPAQGGGTLGLSPQQIVIRGEVLDRLAIQSN
jgi:hypothetical protein